MNQQTIYAGAACLVLCGVLLLFKANKSGQAKTGTVMEPVPTVTTVPAPDHNQHTIVAEHESVCSYCKAKQQHPARRFASYHRIEDDSDGEHAHFHLCAVCKEKFVCRFDCTLREDDIHHHEQGLKSRQKPSSRKESKDQDPVSALERLKKKVEDKNAQGSTTALEQLKQEMEILNARGSDNDE